MDHGDMPMIEATASDSFSTKVSRLPGSGWTVTATDQSALHPARNVLDGSNGTIWHSAYAPVATPLPHSVIIDLHQTRSVSGLLYLPRQDASKNGTIGRYSISLSTDGTNWVPPVATGTWADDKSRKTVVFPGVAARYVRLTALSEAGGRGPWSSAADVGLVGDPAADPPRPRTGWVVTAGDQAAEHPATNVLDGNGQTIWHTPFRPATPLPHSLTIDLRTPASVTGLTYLPRQDASSNGTIGAYSISVSDDATTWGSPVTAGTWPDDKAPKVATFAEVTARYVRLTASSEAGNRGPWSSAAEVNVLAPGPAPDVGGQWAAPIGFPIVPVSAILLPNNKLLTFAAHEGTAFDKTGTVTKVAILDLRTGIVGQSVTIDVNHQMFCSGLVILADGRLLVTGGSSDRASTFYNPATNSWTAGPPMKIPRAYQGDTLISTGQVFTIGGSWHDSAGNKNGELFTPSGSTGSWAKLPTVTSTKILTADPAGVFRADNHVWLLAASNGMVFHAGPSKQMNWITTSGSGSIKGAGRRGDSPDAMNGNAVMYDVGKILTVGGATAYQDFPPAAVNTQGTRRAYVVDITGGPSVPVVTTRVSDMTYARSFSNSVVLPDGRVLVLGGQQHPQAFTDTGAVLSPELWDPATGRFTVMAADVIPRTYHAVAVLLPDARVFSGGGGLCGSCTTNHPDGRIFTPPYLLNPDGTLKSRPNILDAPSAAAAGSTVTVRTDTPTPTFALVRTSAVTHSVNNNQRRIPLVPMSTSGTTYTLRVPADRGVALPGTYLLFALGVDGTPSIARFVAIN
jgi:galactose oxidase